MTLDLDDTADALIRLDNALVIPPLTEARLREQPSGVLDADGRFVEQSISWNDSTSPVNAAPNLPEGAETAALTGRYIFGGVFYGHFGHFIVESLSRIWALDAVPRPIIGMIFTPKVPRVDARTVSIFSDLIRAMGVDVPVLIAKTPTRISELWVPRQGFGMNDLSGGSAAFRAFINTHAGQAVPAEGPERLYISRSRLPPQRGSILGETRLESYLADEGYEIFHPQTASQQTQIARYKAARQVIGTDCSPLHLLGYVGDAGQRVAVITRRSMPIGAYLVRQLTEFKGMAAVEVNALVNDWMPQPGGRPSRSSFGEVDFPRLHAGLLAAGLIHGRTPWPSLTRDERDADLARLAATHQTHFKPFRPDLAA